MKVQVLVTADYELFHGRNFGSHDEVLFQPTEKLLRLASEMQVPVTLFADVCSAWAHRAASLESFSERFERQLSEALAGGHDVQLHLHPHWLVAEHTASEGWNLREQKIQLAEFGFGEKKGSASWIVREGRRYLEDLLRPVSPGYRCLAFRAGGLALEPGLSELILALMAEDIMIDSSVAKGLHLQLDTLNIDYRDTPAEANWYLSSSGEKGLYEIPIATFQASLSERLGFLARRARALKQRRGTGLSRAHRQSRISNTWTLILENLRYLGRSPVFLFSADTKGFSRDMLLDGFDQYVQAHSGQSSLVVSMINHPKLMFDRELRLLREVLAGLKDRYGSSISFETYESISKGLA